MTGILTHLSDLDISQCMLSPSGGLSRILIVFPMMLPLVKTFLELSSKSGDIYICNVRTGRDVKGHLFQLPPLTKAEAKIQNNDSLIKVTRDLLYHLLLILLRRFALFLLWADL